MTSVRIHPEVQDALQAGRPVVALESAVITSGLPAEPVKLPAGLVVEGWKATGPANLELARAMERTVRAAGAVPATVAVIEGQLRIGLGEQDIERLATDRNAGKVSSTGLAHALTSGATAGTTVSATLAACKLTQSKIQNPKSKMPPPGIRVFATGGIGGVHRNWQQHPDISADLRAIAQTAVCVVCAGAKSILDVPATLEMLETLGVPVVGYRTTVFPQFQCAGSDDLQVSQCVDDPGAAARLCAMHWLTLQRSGGGVVLANRVPSEWAMSQEEIETATEAAERLAASKGIGGAERTPFLLREIARATGNRSLHANLALLVNNARLAANLAAELQLGSNHADK